MQRTPYHRILALALFLFCVGFGLYRYTHPKKPHHHYARWRHLEPKLESEYEDSLATARDSTARR